MTDIKSLLPDELKDLVLLYGQPAYRAKQIFRFLSQGCVSFGDMQNLPMEFRKKLTEDCLLTPPELLKKQVSSRDGTVKYLWGFPDGSAVETVLMSYEHGNSLCLSTQVGCRQGCAFCASAIGGLQRNLSAGEMLDEVIFSIKDSGKPVHHLVLMGIGEPLDNFDNVLRFLRLVNAPEGLNISLRNITLSTCGLIDGMEKLSEENLPVTLAVSLHAPDDETRSRLMPVNRSTGVKRLSESCQAYFRKTGRRISFEYALISGVNDSENQAAALASLAKKCHAHVNLISLNHVSERNFAPSEGQRLKAFTGVLDAKQVRYTFRRKLGGDIDASCGQLRRRVQMPESLQNNDV